MGSETVGLTVLLKEPPPYFPHLLVLFIVVWHAFAYQVLSQCATPVPPFFFEWEKGRGTTHSLYLIERKWCVTVVRLLRLLVQLITTMHSPTRCNLHTLLRHSHINRIRCNRCSPTIFLLADCGHHFSNSVRERRASPWRIPAPAARVRRRVVHSCCQRGRARCSRTTPPRPATLPGKPAHTSSE